MRRAGLEPAFLGWNAQAVADYLTGAHKGWGKTTPFLFLDFRGSVWESQELFVWFLGRTMG